MLEEGHRFPSVSLYTGWVLWLQGNPAKKIPAYRKIRAEDVPLIRDPDRQVAPDSERKIYSEWRQVMSYIEEIVREHADLPATAFISPSDETVKQLYSIAAPYLPRPPTTSGKKIRRIEDLHVTSVNRIRKELLRKAKKRQADEEMEEEEVRHDHHPNGAVAEQPHARKTPRT